MLSPPPPPPHSCRYPPTTPSTPASPPTPSRTHPLPPHPPPLPQPSSIPGSDGRFSKHCGGVRGSPRGEDCRPPRPQAHYRPRVHGVYYRRNHDVYQSLVLVSAAGANSDGGGGGVRYGDRAGVHHGAGAAGHQGNVGVPHGHLHQRGDSVRVRVVGE